eukprot:742433-Pleurochrysis_carterae.AAC.3
MSQQADEAARAEFRLKRRIYMRIYRQARARLESVVSVAPAAACVTIPPSAILLPTSAEPSAVTQPVLASVVTPVKCVDYAAGIHCFPKSSKLVQNAVNRNAWYVKQTREVQEVELDEDGWLTRQVAILLDRTRSRKSSLPLVAPSSFIPVYSAHLQDHPKLWRPHCVMTEDIWAGRPLSPNCTTQPIGSTFTIDAQHRGVQRYSFQFPDGDRRRVEWAAVYIPEEQRRAIGTMHINAAHLLTNSSLAQPDTLATESACLPVGYATMECGNYRPYALPHTDNSLSQAHSSLLLRMPYARVNALRLQPFVRSFSPWLGVAAAALDPSSLAPSPSMTQTYFDFPPSDRQQSPASNGAYLSGHQVSVKLRGLPVCDEAVASRLPAAKGQDFAAMHTDKHDAGYGTI